MICLFLGLAFSVAAQVHTAEVDLVVDGTNVALPWLRESKGLLFYTLDNEYASGTEMHLACKTDGYRYQCLVATDSRTLKLAVLYCGPAVASVPPQQNMVLDDTRGRDYLCLIYSDKPIDADQLLKKYAKAEGNFYSRMETSLKEYRTPASEVRYIQNRLGLTCYSNGMVPLYIEVEHR